MKRDGSGRGRAAVGGIVLSAQRHRTPRRLGWLALAASAVIHLVLLLALRFHTPGIRFDDGARTAAGARPPVMSVVSIRAVERDLERPAPLADVRDVERVEPPARTEAATDVVSGGAETSGATVLDPKRTVADRIAPATGDRRLWERPPGALTPALERMGNIRERVGLSIAEYNDSVAEAAETARRAADWTMTRAYGERWGFSPDTIHLGNTRRVLRQCSAGPCPGTLLQPPVGRRDEQAARLRIFNETQTQAKRAELERAFQERVRALRTHSDSVRATRRGGG